MATRSYGIAYKVRLCAIPYIVKNRLTIRHTDCKVLLNMAKPALRVRKSADFGTPERHAKGDIRLDGTMAAGQSRARAVSAWEMMDRRGSLAPRHARAAEMFRDAFEAASLLGHYSTMRLERGDRGRNDPRDHGAEARESVRRALDHLPSDLSRALAWWLIGHSESIDATLRRLSSRGEIRMNRHHLAGALIITLDGLAGHYGLP